MILILLLVLGIPLLMLVSRVNKLRDQMEALSRRVDELRQELNRLKTSSTAPEAARKDTGGKISAMVTANLPPRRGEWESPSVPEDKTLETPPVPPPQPIPAATSDVSVGEAVPWAPAANPVPAESEKPAAEAPAKEPSMVPPPLPPWPPIKPPVEPAPVREEEPVMAARVSAAKADEPLPAPEKSSLEMKVGTYWLVRVGIIILITGLAFGANLAYQTIIPKLGPGGKISLLYLASGLLLAAGAWWQRHNVKESLKNYAQVLFAGGLAAVYFTTYAAYYLPPVKVIASPLLDGLLLFIWAGVIAGIADRRQSQIMALFGVGLAFFSSVITRVGDFTLYANLLLTLAAVYFLVRNRWAGLSFASLVTTYAGYAFWRFLHDDGWRWATPDEHLWFGAGFLGCYWVVFTVAAFLSRSKYLSGSSRAAFLTLNNGAFFTLFLLTMLQVHSGGFWKFSLSYGLALLALAGAAKRWLPAEPLAKNAYLTQGLVLMTLGFIAKFSGLKLALVLGAESIVLFMIGCQRQSWVLKTFAYAAALLAFGWCGATAESFTPPDLIMAVALGAMLAVNAGWALRLETRATEKSLCLESTFFALLAFASWTIATWRNTEEAHLPATLVLGVESLLFYNLKGWQKVLAPRIAAYASAGIAVFWSLQCLSETVTSGWWIGAILGAILMVNAWRADREGRDNPQPLRPEVMVFTLLAFICWLAATWRNTAGEYLPLALAAEAVALTFSIYLLRIREITLLGQLFLVLAQAVWLFRFVGTTPPWWNPLGVIVVTIGLSHWWQHQKVLAISRQIFDSGAALFAVAAVAVTLVWLHPLVSAPAWLAATSLLAVAVTGYGLITRAWALAISGQIFLVASVWACLQQFFQEKPEWYFPLAPLGVLAALSIATLAWSARRPEAPKEVRLPLLQAAMIYRWLALALSLIWIWDYVPERQRVWACMLMAAAVFALALWRNAREALVAAAVYAGAAILLLWVRADLVMDVYWPNGLSLLVLLAMQQTLRRLPAGWPLDEKIHGAVVLRGGFEPVAVPVLLDAGSQRFFHHHDLGRVCRGGVGRRHPAA